MVQNLSRIVAQDKNFLNIINGRRVAALSQETITVLCPSDGLGVCNHSGRQCR